MQPEKISTNIADIESEAEKTLEDARARASGILLEAKEEAKKILVSQLPMDEIETKCQEIIQSAKIEADKKSKDSASKASEIETNANKKIKDVVERMVDIITGAKSA